jgi:excisionase family DNA binding protein
MVGVRGGRINRAMRKKASNPGSRRVTALTLPGEIMANEAKYSLPRVMTVKELSDYLRVHPSTIYKLLRRGELPGFRIGTDWRFNAEVIDRWCLERNMKGPDGGTSTQN